MFFYETQKSKNLDFFALVFGFGFYETGPWQGKIRISRFWRQRWSRTEIRLSLRPAPPRELSIKKKFDPIRSNTKKFERIENVLKRIEFILILELTQPYLFKRDISYPVPSISYPIEARKKIHFILQKYPRRASRIAHRPSPIAQNSIRLLRSVPRACNGDANQAGGLHTLHESRKRNLLTNFPRSVIS